MEMTMENVSRSDRAITPLAKCSSAPLPPRTPDAAALAMLRRIAEVLAEDGRCHTAAVVSHPNDLAELGDLERLGLIDTDLCSHCDSATAHNLTDEGLAVLAGEVSACLSILRDGETIDLVVYGVSHTPGELGDVELRSVHLDARDQPEWTGEPLDDAEHACALRALLEEADERAVVAHKADRDAYTVIGGAA
jgi:hypothetical protein